MGIDPDKKRCKYDHVMYERTSKLITCRVKNICRRTGFPSRRIVCVETHKFRNNGLEQKLALGSKWLEVVYARGKSMRFCKYGEVYGLTKDGTRGGERDES